MSTGMMTLSIVVMLLGIMSTGFPIALSLLFVAIAGILLWANPAALSIIPSTIIVMTTKDFFIALPMFIFMAGVLQVSGVGTTLYDTFWKWLAGLRGGLAAATVAVSTLLAATTGSGSTAVVTLGMIAYPEMKKRGYSKYLSVGSICAGGCLGPLIPPSITMILVAAYADISIGKLFISGVLPGLLVSGCFILYILGQCYLHPERGPAIPRDERVSWKEKFISLKGAILPILLIFFVLGFIYIGISTPSEAGGIGAFGALCCAAYYRNLTIANLKKAMTSSIRITAMIFWIIIGGSAFSSLLAMTGVSNFIGELMIGANLNRWVIFTIMMVIIFVLGMLMDSTPIVIITMPIFIPIIRTLEFDPLWFGLVVTMNLLIGFLTPPFGLSMFYFKGIGHKDVSMLDLYKGCLPFVCVMAVALIFCVIFPGIATWLPNQMIR
jgi:tripartite ATP-independent transporter DctM subunit